MVVAVAGRRAPLGVKAAEERLFLLLAWELKELRLHLCVAPASESTQLLERRELRLWVAPALESTQLLLRRELRPCVGPTQLRLRCELHLYVGPACWVLEELPLEAPQLLLDAELCLGAKPRGALTELHLEAPQLCLRAKPL